MMAYKFTIPIAPIPKARPRVTRHGTYTPAKTKQNQQAIQLYAKSLCIKPLSGALGVDITFYLSIPKSWSKARKQAAKWHTVRPDTDNLIKQVADSLNGIAWKDDSQIAQCIARKQYSDNPRIDVTIYPLT